MAVDCEPEIGGLAVRRRKDGYEAASALVAMGKSQLPISVFQPGVIGVEGSRIKLVCALGEFTAQDRRRRTARALRQGHAEWCNQARHEQPDSLFWGQDHPWL